MKFSWKKFLVGVFAVASLSSKGGCDYWTPDQEKISELDSLATQKIKDMGYNYHFKINNGYNDYNKDPSPMRVAPSTEENEGNYCVSIGSDTTKKFALHYHRNGRDVHIAPIDVKYQAKPVVTPQ